ncbi:MAG: TolC family protein [Granulosicoccaceae bacterium]
MNLKNRLYATAMLGMLVSALHAAEDSQQAPIPERLTLGQALAILEESRHPELERARADIERAEAGQLEAQSQTGLDVRVIGRLQTVEPNDISPDQSHGDSSIGLYATKPLYDFGRSEAQSTAADALYRARQSSFIDTRNAQRIEVMQRFFDVILADHEFLRDNEDMASRFVRMDKASDRNELGQVSDVEVLRLETVYQQARLNRYRSEARQRATRARLAIALNRPAELPGEVVRPELPILQRDAPEDIQELQRLAIQNNPVIVAAKSRVESSQASVAAARAGDSPVLSAEAELADYDRKFGSRDEARLGLKLEVPLFTGGRSEAAVARSRAELRKARAELTAAETAVQGSVLDTVLEIRTLRAQLDQVRAQRNWSELNLDLRRSEYELEKQATLGDAMIEIAKAELFAAQTEFQLALAWARLDALLGKTVFDTAAAQQTQTTTDR